MRSLLGKDALAVHVGAERLVSCTTQHAFAKAAHDAFYDHHPLVVRPDDVWFCIAQGFAHHVRENAEALRERFVRHRGKERLVVSRPDFRVDGDNPWPEAFEAFAGLIGEHVGAIRDLVAARFTTTTSVEAAAYDVCLMDTFQGYFEYEFRIGCGIPSISLLGTRADWESMIPRVRHLSEYGLAWWTDALVPILEQLARTADGDVDRAFWRSFFRYESGSGSAELTGWIVALFPYINDWSTKELERSPYVANWGERFRVSESRTGWLRMGEEQGPTIGMLPEGLVGAPVRLVDLATREASDVRFVAGMFGVAQAQDTGALSSTFGWPSSGNGHARWRRAGHALIPPPHQAPKCHSLALRFPPMTNRAALAQLELRPIGQIEGSFRVARYQRGYRWGQQEVEQLLNDVEGSKGGDYSLQPVVVKRLADAEWELVDGQQRLTTLYLIYLYMQRAGLKNVPPGYTITYETRPASQSYLSELDEARSADNIDFFHLYGAHRCIAQWFEARNPRERQFLADNLYRYLFETVRVIWYEAPPDADVVDLFTRLNVGRIPLTDAELVKALVLSRARGGGGHGDRSHEVAAQWDSIERDLRRPEVWAFVTQREPAESHTRISLLLDTLADLICPPAGGRRRLFYTFDTLRAALDQDGWEEVWNRVVDLHARVLGWYEDRSVFHKIGYLVSVGQRFSQLVAQATEVGCTKRSFHLKLDDHIRKSLRLSATGVLDQRYGLHDEKLGRLLLLMNVDTVCRMAHSSERYSFRLHREGKWSLEHIHAQQAQGLTRAEQWQEWLRLHADALRDLPTVDGDARDALLARIAESYDGLTGDTFKALSAEVTARFGAEDGGETFEEQVTHSILNLALLEVGDNAALSNAVFEVKRRRVLEFEAKGAYIPECTRRVFLKYYTPARAQQVHFWGAQDRDAYRDAMLHPETGILTPYLEPEEPAAEPA